MLETFRGISTLQGLTGFRGGGKGLTQTAVFC